MKRILLEGPAVEPVSLAEAKAHLRLDHDAEDPLVGALIAAARVAVETEIRRVLVAQSWRVLVENWPAGGLFLPIVPVMAVDEVRAIDVAGAPIELAEGAFEFEAADGSVRLLDHVPGASCYEIDFTAGYGVSGVDTPQPLRQAIRLLVTHWFENRSAAVTGDTSTAAALGYRELVAPYRRISLC